MGQLRLTPLADHVDLVPTVALWFYQEWAHLNPGSSVEATAKRISGRLNRDRIPTMFIAFVGDTPVGCAGLLEYDSSVDIAIEKAHSAAAARGQADMQWLESRVIPTPWLVSVYVVPVYRRRGFAGRLVRHNMHMAKNLGVKTLYLYTENDGAEALYRGLGWQVVERLFYPDLHETMMAVDLSDFDD